MKKMKSSSAAKTLYLLGAGGHAKVVADLVALDRRYKKIVLVEKKDESRIFSAKACVHALVAVGDNHLRRTIAARITDQAAKVVFPTFVHPSAVIAAHVRLGAGTVVMAGAVVNMATTVGEHTILNTGCVVDHDCSIASFGSVGPGASLGGNVSLGEESSVGIGASVAHGISIATQTVVGAGAVVIRDLPALVVAYGVPAAVARKRKAEEAYL